MLTLHVCVCVCVCVCVYARVCVCSCIGFLSGFLLTLSGQVCLHVTVYTKEFVITLVLHVCDTMCLRSNFPSELY